MASASDITVSNLVSAVNLERSQRNIPTLTYNSKLAAAADYKSHDMIARKYFSHTDPEGKYIWDKITQEGYTPYTILGENLAIDFSDTAGLVAAWIDSPTHRANLLNTNFKDQGMGVAYGNTNNGEFSVAVANTFGAQPTAKKTEVAQTPTPTTKPSTTTTPTTTPKPVAKPVAKTTATQPAPTITLSINNSEDVLYKNTLTIVGKTSPNTALTLKDLNSPNQESIAVTSDANGNFVYTYKTLNNGEHNFVATIGSTSSNNYKVAILYNPPQIDRDSLSISPSIENNALTLNVSAKINGEPAQVNASLSGKTVAMVLGAENVYSGTLSFEKYFNYQTESLVITAQDKYGNKNNLSAPLDSYPLPDQQNPKDFGDLGQKAAAPDLYNTFKYIVIIFGGLFVIFLFGEATHLTRKKNR
jgi:hypothetical protein